MIRFASLLHAFCAFVLICAIIVHIYAAIWVKGSVRAMTRGTVSYGPNDRYCLDGQRLINVQLFDQQNNVPATLIPIIQLDMWEHAFYLDYLNVKGDYVKAWWNIANWADAQARFTAATSGGQIIF